MSSESDFHAWLQSQIHPHARVELSIGDDLAILNWDAADLLLVGVDQVLDGVHFDSRIHSPEAIGRKAMNRNLSDCAAMGCLPAAAVVSAAVPKGCGLDYLQSLQAGLRSAAELFDCAIVGGDTGSWNGALAISVTILGRSAGIAPLRRGGARMGEGIYVTGALGGSILGRHMTFEPRVAAGRTLAGGGNVTAMIDLSDGLSRDLPRLLGRSHGAVIEASNVPIHADARVDRADGLSALQHALHDGEDYELLFTAALQPSIGRRIGSVTDGAKISLIADDGAVSDLQPGGWEHGL